MRPELGPHASAALTLFSAGTGHSNLMSSESGAPSLSTLQRTVAQRSGVQSQFSSQPAPWQVKSQLISQCRHFPVSAAHWDGLGDSAARARPLSRARTRHTALDPRMIADAISLERI